MVDDICCSEFEDCVAGGGFFGGGGVGGGDFGVFDDAWFTVFEDDETDWFFWVTFTDYFCCDVEILGEGVAYEDWVCDADEAVVYAIGVNVLNLATLEVS